MSGDPKEERNPRADCVIQGIAEMMCSGETPEEIRELGDKFCIQELRGCPACDKPLEACATCPPKPRTIYVLEAVVQEIDCGSWVVRAYKDKDEAHRIAAESNEAALKINAVVGGYYNGEYMRLMDSKDEKEVLGAMDELDRLKRENPHPHDPMFHRNLVSDYAKVLYGVFEIDLV